MDRKLIEEYGEDILSYRLRSARQKKRAQREDFDKKLLRLDRESDALDDLLANLGWEPLVPPVQKGWARFFVMREDVARSKHAEFYDGILKKINTHDWSHRKDFMIRKRRYGSNKFIVKPQNLLSPTSWHFEKLHFSEAERRQFHEVYMYDSQGRLTQRFVFNEPWRFALRVRPNMVTKVKKRDEVIEARLAEICDYLEWNAHRGRLTKLLEGSCGNKFWRYSTRIKDKGIKNKSLTQIMDMIRET
ncbi:hypothetical protein [Paraflavitalea sp. CAU 1676]|uniref:hypothetical protein n=1 Tax=Paraflavitalea sp. CAU 1676 TaxID=3032598 RepID=UPI0023DC9321|nr:hypothetical protein [Paraflavitalea sp. CAU 1676]MDF2190660.1 hypothetical protein [Paraflavitalea sp. CAU 1676]